MKKKPDSIQKELSSSPKKNDNPNNNSIAIKHLAFFVHGLRANPRELEYLKAAMPRLLQEQKGQARFICDDSLTGKAFQGFRARGSASSNIHYKKIGESSLCDDSVFLSIIGCSCGGVFCRSALRYLNLDRVTPLLCCTIASLHLRLGQQSGFPTPP